MITRVASVVLSEPSATETEETQTDQMTVWFYDVPLVVVEFASETGRCSDTSCACYERHILAFLRQYLILHRISGCRWKCGPDVGRYPIKNRLKCGTVRICDGLGDLNIRYDCSHPFTSYSR